jgi:hypothetical protein
LSVTLPGLLCAHATQEGSSEDFIFNEASGSFTATTTATSFFVTLFASELQQYNLRQRI